ncbi:MAG: MFS transporter [Phycicoccus sp.]
MCSGCSRSHHLPAPPPTGSAREPWQRRAHWCSRSRPSSRRCRRKVISSTLLAGLFLLGLGWSCTLVAGSTMLVAAVPLAERPGAQGASDLLMGLAAAAGGVLAGIVVDQLSYRVLALLALGVAVVIGITVSTARRAGPTSDDAQAS